MKLNLTFATGHVIKETFDQPNLISASFPGPFVLHCVYVSMCPSFSPSSFLSASVFRFGPSHSLLLELGDGCESSKVRYNWVSKRERERERESQVT